MADDGSGDGAGSDADGPAADDDEAPDLLVEGADDDEPVALGDRRKKHVSVTTRAGERVEHGDVYLKHAAGAFEVCPDPGFPEDATTRYETADLRRVEVTQHHAACFVTTAAAGEGPTLDALRGFRDDAMRPTPVGRLLLAGYAVASPPVARSLERHPDAATTRATRWLVERCAALARRRTATDRRLVALALSVVLVAAYVLGVAGAALGAAGLRLRDRVGGR